MRRGSVILRDPAGWVHLETAQAFPALHDPKRVFVSSVGSGSVVRNKANPDRIRPGFQHLKQGPSI